MSTSSTTRVHHARLRVIGWGLAQVLAGAALAGSVVLLPVFRVDVCDEGWRAAPAGLLAVAAVLAIVAVRFAAPRLFFATAALVLTAFAVWVLYFASALGCD